MAPGMIISKLGIEAAAGTSDVTGLLCLKVSLPRDVVEGKQPTRYPLFGAQPPKLSSQPLLLPLPLSSSSFPSSQRASIETASRLLSVSFTSYPPSSGWSVKPYLDVSSTSGQVYIVAGDNRRVSPNNNASSSGSSSGGGGRREWLVVMHFETGIERTYSGSSKISLSLPKCLDNVIRFQILSPDPSSSTGEVSIITEPKMLPLPSDSFSPTKPSASTGQNRNGPVWSSTSKLKGEDGWEDGEVLGPDDEEEDGEDSEDEGSWLEGRFQSTESLKLEWSFTSSDLASGSSVTLSTLHVLPQWDAKRPSINVLFETTIPANTEAGNVVPIEAVLPGGWGWSTLALRGESLKSWQSVDGDWFDELLQPPETDMGDDEEASFATVRLAHKARPGLSDMTPSRSALGGNGPKSLIKSPPFTPSSTSSASLLRQTLPSSLSHMDDFSFEVSGMMDSPTQYHTPTAKISTPQHYQSPAAPPTPAVEKRQPVPAKLFDLTFDPAYQGDRAFTLEGTIVPISPTTLVTPSVPTDIPFIRLDLDALASCTVNCPSATFHQPLHQSPHHVVVDTSFHIGCFEWTDDAGNKIAHGPVTPPDKDVHVVLRSTWVGLSMSILFHWPVGAKEIGLDIPSASVSIFTARTGGLDMARALTRTGMEETQIRLGQNSRRGRGSSDLCELVLALPPNAMVEQGRKAKTLENVRSIPLPHFAGTGQMHVELKGDGWESDRHYIGNLRRIDTQRFTYDLSADTPPSMTFHRRPSSSWSLGTRLRLPTLFSWSTLFNLFLLWLLLSMGQQVQRLRNEVSFVADETRDLRLYGLHQPPGPDRQSGSATSPTGSITNIPAVPDVPPPQPEAEPEDPAPLGSIANTASTGYNPPQAAMETGVGTSRTDVIVDRKADGSMAIGRVVFGSHWDHWSHHPTVKTLGRGIGWIWSAVVWLVAPS